MKEILKNLVEPMTLPEDSYLEQDPEIFEFFVEEIEEIFSELNGLFNDWLTDSSDKDTLVSIRRYFHTLKGSGRMVGAMAAGEMAWTVEDMLNRVIAGTLILKPVVQRYAQTVLNIYQYKLYPKFKAFEAIDLDLRPVVLLGQQLQQDLIPEPVLSQLLNLSDTLLDSDTVTGLENYYIEEILEQEDLVEQAWVQLEQLAELEPVKEVAEQEVAQDLDETIEIFIEEAEEHLHKIQQFLLHDQLIQDYNLLLRALHTLRGSSSMAHIEPMFEASSKLEKLFKSLVQDDIESSSTETTLLSHYAEFVSEYLAVLRSGEIERGTKVTQDFNDAWDEYQHLLPIEEIGNEQGIVSELISLEIDDLLDAEFDFIRRADNEYPDYLENIANQAKRLTDHTNNRAASGIHEYAAGLEHAYQAVLERPELLKLADAENIFLQVHEEFIHLFDTLATGERVQLSGRHQQLLSQLYIFVDQDLAEELVEEQVEVVQPNVDLGYLAQRVAQDAEKIDSPDAHQDFDEVLVDIFLEEAEELLEGIDADLSTWSTNQGNLSALQNLMRYLHTLKGGANMVQATYIGTLAHELETIYERLINQPQQVSSTFIQIIRLVQDNVSDRIQLMKERRIDYPVIQAVDILRHIHALAQGRMVSSIVDEVVDDVGLIVNDSEPSVETTASSANEVLETLSVDSAPDLAEISSVDEDATMAFIKPEHETALAQEGISSVVTESFLEEAHELLDSCSELLTQWFDQRANRSLLLQLQRAIHSLKGGARILELEPISDIAYELENIFEQFALHQFNSNAYDGLLQTTITWLNKAIFEKDYRNFEQIQARLQAVEYVDVTAQLPTRVTEVDLFDANKAFMIGDGTEPPAMMGEWDDAQQAESNNEMIRISADLVEKMIDLAGENSINRSRIEMDLGRLGNTINEMELTIQRLADQLRRMEGELETQILAKHGTENSVYEEFDPLEMDQYSSLNQLSKSLSESASDLLDFKSTLAEKIRDAESLLLQQSRIQSEIQESLMRTRLVPFSGMLPRLQRIVRQTSTTLNRPTELVVRNTEGELDRTILERLVTPFEHMLRNAVDHGIESPEERATLGKPKTGQIELNISRQGTDVVISFNDDGRGIDAQKIRGKALSLGLIKPTQTLATQEIMQLIFHPGFSTAKTVTQISGRGVGLDIVQSEIKILGGHISVDSEYGKGTTFTIRVPTTVAISDALMVKVADQQYALPLAQIDRIVRIPPSVLEDYFNSESDFFTIDQHQYKLRYLSEFLTHQSMPRLSSMGHSLPVLLIKSASGQTIALLVDQLIGSRAQIVVKTIGQQFSKLGAIAGATIMGDGQVCLILDGQNIARQIQVTQRTKDTSKQRDLYATSAERKLIMIVDDSVTVRKVTTRLLERQGYEVITAKDGLDAVEQLESVKPDLMLLDIEMPRMDGFEVTNLVRHHEIHQDLPIIMITSRTGEKHRERAFGLGVTDYMGKPFQEADLVANIEKHLARKQDYVNE